VIFLRKLIFFSIFPLRVELKEFRPKSSYTPPAQGNGDRLKAPIKIDMRAGDAH